MSATVDTNILVYASDELAPEYRRAQELLDSVFSGPTLTTLFWPVLLGYVRIVTHPRVSRRPLSVATATAVIDELLDSPSINVVGEAPTFWAGYRSLDIGRPIAGNDVPDAAIVALMLPTGCPRSTRGTAASAGSTGSVSSTHSPEPRTSVKSEEKCDPPHFSSDGAAVRPCGCGPAPWRSRRCPPPGRPPPSPHRSPLRPLMPR